jgi:hypothetical protein
MVDSTSFNNTSFHRIPAKDEVHNSGLNLFFFQPFQALFLFFGHFKTLFHTSDKLDETKAGHLTCVGIEKVPWNFGFHA